MNQSQRIEIVNKIIIKISETERGFFLHENTTSEIRAKGGNVFYFDEYSKREIDLYVKETKPNAYHYFSHGGNLRRLVFEEFADFIAGDNVEWDMTDLNAWHWGIPNDQILALKSYAQSLGYFDVNPISTKAAKCPNCNKYHMIAKMERFRKDKETQKEFTQLFKKGFEILNTTTEDARENFGFC